MLIDPIPEVAPIALPWDAEVADPIAAIAGARASCGDTFVVDSPDGPFLFLFSPAGVRSFYALPESAASKGIADWRMISRKLPEELFDGRRTMPHDLFGRAGTAAYLAQLEQALDIELDALGAEGMFEAFAFTRRLGHRMGLASWGGEASARGDRFDRLVPALDALDGSDAFVHPEAMAAVQANGKRVERAALATADEVLGESVDERLATGRQDDLFQQIVDRWSDEAPDDMRRGVARDVVLVHLGSMSNLFAALGWTIVDLLAHPELAAAVAAGDAQLAERCALESTRLAQRSIMLRYVHQPVEVADEARTYAVSPGATIATLLPLTNLDSAPGLDRWDPERWKGRRLRDADALAAVELVTAFGHGSHTCPAQPFSLAAMSRTVMRLFSTFTLDAAYDHAEPLPVQIGGVARAAAPCPVRYRR
ncbi:MAG: cytochrome [Actinomycetia bacterium]|nr:cytochrome [Actinomycetes bacterium]